MHQHKAGLIEIIGRIYVEKREKPHPCTFSIPPLSSTFITYSIASSVLAKLAVSLLLRFLIARYDKTNGRIKEKTEERSSIGEIGMRKTHNGQPDPLRPEGLD